MAGIRKLHNIPVLTHPIPDDEIIDLPHLNLYQTTNFRPVQNKILCRQQNKCDSKVELCLGKGRKLCGKRRKCWLPAFSPFPTMFSTAFFLRVVRSQDCVVKKKRPFANGK